MAQVAIDTKKYLSLTDKPSEDHWQKVYGIGSKVPASGIYRCTTCGDEITSNKGDQFPPQNKTQHPCQDEKIYWELIVMTQTKGSGR
ncbi:hypothetical protein [Pseudomonas donghuensis]|uniref:Protein L n=1 Tax=Pseudomonas donghuensis TaxID=1163398 RepID=A0AAQ0DN83_9PSED|nr:hypothetical protein [Pseudomonas donghuensis]MCP6691367.1 protein L [Pseudomonas donghuensis]QWE81285.1 protein L [Pseudomonas donghuensis]